MWVERIKVILWLITMGIVLYYCNQFAKAFVAFVVSTLP